MREMKKNMKAKFVSITKLLARILAKVELWGRIEIILMTVLPKDIFYNKRNTEEMIRFAVTWSQLNPSVRAITI